MEINVNNSDFEDRKPAKHEIEDRLNLKLPEFLQESLDLLRQTAEVNHVSRMSLYVNFWINYILFGDEAPVFVMNSQFRYSILERIRRTSCYNHLDRIDRVGSKTATKQDIDNLSKKNLFVKNYAEFIGRETMYAPEHTNEELHAFVKKFGGVIVKPVDNYGGNGIYKLNAEDCTDEKLNELREKHYIVEEILKQHHLMASINESSVNTVRMVTLLDCDGVPHVYNAFIRAGKQGSIVDNGSAGGVQYPVDEFYGIVNSYGTTHKAWIRYAYHPGSNTKMLGFRIPNYDIACEMVKKAAIMTPKIRLVGWDVVITEEGAVLIEGNQFPGLQELDGIARYYDARRWILNKKR